MNLVRVEKTFRGDSHHSISPSETVERALARVKAANLDAKINLNDISRFGVGTIPVYKAGGGPRSGEWGKGVSIEQSRASALMEAVERYSAVTAAKSRIRTRGRVHQEALEYVSFKALVPSNIQHFLYDDLDTLDDSVIDWVQAARVGNEAAVLVPATRAFLAYRSPNITDFTCSNGLSANNTLEEAIVQGASEVIERHIYHTFYLNKANRCTPRINLASAVNEHLIQTIENLESAGYVVLANDHSDDWSIPTVSTLVFNPSDNRQFNSVGAYVHFGTAPDPEIALIRCLTETVQSIAVCTLKGAFSSTEEVPAFVKDEIQWRLLADKTHSFSKLPNCSKSDFLEEINEVERTIGAHGSSLIYCDLTDPKLGLPVVRVLCPGLQPNFLLLGRAPNSFKSAISKHIEAQDDILSEVKLGNFFEQKVTQWV